MNIKLNAFRDGNYAGGVMSRFMWMLPNAVKYDIDNIYFDSFDVRWMQYPVNGFDFVFKQWHDASFMGVECKNLGTFTRLGNGIGAIENSPDLRKMKDICSKLILKDEIMDFVNMYDVKGALGVHVRVGDMNVCHPEYGVLTTQHFVTAMRELRPTKVFIATDNDESIEIIKDEIRNRFPTKCNIIYVNGLIREGREVFLDASTQMNNFQNPKLWQQVFVEALLLSKCSSLLCRVSNVPNVAYLFSNTIKKIHRL